MPEKREAIEKEYRTYTVKGDALDDLRMMREVVERWIKRVEDWPDLLLIDGGETHLAIIAKPIGETWCERQDGTCKALAKRRKQYTAKVMMTSY